MIRLPPNLCGLNVRKNEEKMQIKRIKKGTCYNLHFSRHNWVRTQRSALHNKIHKEHEQEPLSVYFFITSPKEEKI